MDDVPFDLRHLRCIVYEHNRNGLRQLQSVLNSTLREISEVTYRFSVQNDDSYEFDGKLPGDDNCFHDFKISGVWVTRGSTKFYLQEFRHYIADPTNRISEVIAENSYMLNEGEGKDLVETSWRLVLEEIRASVAHFRVVKKPERKLTSANQQGRV